MNKKLVLTGIFMVMLAIILGAFGAHGLKNIVSPEKVESFETGVRYQFYAAFSLLIVGLSAQQFSFSLKGFSTFLILGVTLFSGSIYALSLQEYLGVKLSFLGPITPLGGLLMIISWCVLFVKLWKKPNQ